MMRRRSAPVRFGGRLLLAAALVVAPTAAATQVFAGTPCAVWASTPATDGNYIWGYSYIDCPSSPISDWVKGEIVETFLPIPITRDDCVNNGNSSAQQSCQTYYYCNGHGTDEWFEKSKGRDSAGGESVWIEGAHVDRTC